MSDETFDVFLSHNSKDKPVVRQIGEALRERGLKVWLDEWELIPGRRWIPELEKAIENTKTAAVMVGENGFGRWEQPEYEAALSQFVNRGLPVIPVLLPGAPEKPKLPLFLTGFTWVNLRDGVTGEGLDLLEWGITGKKPSPKPRLPPPTGSFIHNLPYLPLGDLLTGREQELHNLTTSLQQQSQATAITQTIQGLGGIGKTRLAVEFAWRQSGHYSAAFFVRADSREALESGIAALARPEILNLPEQQAQAYGAVLRYLKENQNYLLILDNVDTEGAALAVGKFLPLLSGGHVLITSRRREWPPGIQRQLLDTLSLDQAAQFLIQRTQHDRALTAEDPEYAVKLAEILDGLPLALEQAASYISHNQISFASYLEAWESEREQVLSWHDETTMQYPTSLAVTWQKSFHQLQSTAGAILRLSSFLAPEPIPSEIFDKGTAILQEATDLLCQEMGHTSGNQLSKAAVSELAAYSMVTKQVRSFIVHRIMQEVLRTQIPTENLNTWISLSVRLVNEFAPPEPRDVRTWGIWDLLRPHAIYVLGYSDRAGITEPTTSLMNQLGSFLYAKSLYQEAEPFLRRAMMLDEDAYGTKHPNVAIRLNNLAQLLKDTNRLSEAEPLMRRALDIDEQAFGPHHPRVAIDLNNLAQFLQATNRLSEAELLIRRALDIDEQAFGSHHPNVTTRLNNLASLLQDTNRLEEAESLMRRALDIDEHALGPNHPRIAIRLNNLARLLQSTNRLAEAEPLMRRAGEISEAALGSDHPITQTVQRNLAGLLAEIASQDTPASGEA